MNDDYEYKPRPPSAEMPPIKPREFEYFLLPHCGSSCVLSLIHDCVESHLGNWALGRIPKRKFAIELKVKSREDAWGLQAQHAPHGLIILLYHVLILSGTFAFWIWWQINHPADLQNAAVPLSVVTVLISLFWSSAGLLKSPR